MTTSFPCRAVLIELAFFFKDNAIKATVQCNTSQPRGRWSGERRHGGFDPRLRCQIVPAMFWLILPEALKMVLAAEEEGYKRFSSSGEP